MAPISALRHWDELSNAEQAAARYGLGFDREAWDGALESEDHSVAVSADSRSSAPADRPAAEPPAEPWISKPGAAAGELVQRSMPWIKAAAQYLPRHSKLRTTVELLGAVVDAVESASAEKVVVQGMEDIVYLDDSSSMAGGRLAAAQSFWPDVAARLRANPVRVVKFGSEKHVLQRRTEELSPTAVALAWNAASGGTYMWHMILEDVEQHYEAGRGRLRIFVITDGHDVMSPPPYKGMSGMDPMMRDLRRKGFDIEFHIIFISGMMESALAAGAAHLLDARQRDDMKRYRDLAEATGGGFLHYALAGTPSEDTEAFLRRLDRGGAGSGSGAAQLRLEARKDYERRLRAGEATKFDWYEQLPPPSRR